MAKNRFEVRDNIVILYLDRKIGEPIEAIIDLDDFKRVNDFKYKWCAKYDPSIEDYYVCSSFYVGRVNGKFTSKPIYLNRFIMNYYDELEVDHINHKTLDNRKENLRLVNSTKNKTNRYDKNSNNTSGYRNVTWDKSRNKWLVQLQVDGVNTVLGEFEYDQLEKANLFAIEMRKLYYGEYRGND